MPEATTICEYHRIQDERSAANAEFDRRVRVLQDNCPHTELTRWLGAYYGEVRLCKNCMKTIERRP